MEKENIRLNCIVLRTADYRENDRVLTLLTEDGERINARSNGCRKSGSVLAGGSFAFSYGLYELAESRGRYFVKAVYSCSSSFGTLSEVRRFTAASVVAELADDCSQAGLSSPLLYGIVLAALKELASLPGEKAVLAAIHAGFALLSAEGVKPVLRCCAVCGAEDAPRFRPDMGGFVCDECSPQGRRISPGLRKAIADTAEGGDTEPERYLQVLIALREFIANALDIQLKSLDVLLKLLKTENNGYGGSNGSAEA